MNTSSRKPDPYSRLSIDEAFEYGRRNPSMHWIACTIGSFENPFYAPPDDERECRNCGAPNQVGTCRYCREPVR